MRSSELAGYGFRTWLAFNRKSEPTLMLAVPSRPGAYVIRCCKDYSRKVGRSDILYFGSATNQQGLKHRLRQYFHPGPTQRTNLRILALVGDSSDYEVSVSQTDSAPEAKFLEARLLEQYESEHGELPPENKRH
jgi:excinuclease UvrABC nuclease subunit